MSIAIQIGSMSADSDRLIALSSIGRSGPFTKATASGQTRS